MIPPKQNHSAHAYIDATRAIAAFAVVWHHCGYDFIGAHRDSFGGQLFTASISLGHPAVVVFFVLSGYLVGSSWMKLRERKGGVSHYVVDRLSRLWTALLPALVLTAILDSIGYYLVPAPTAYRGALNYLDAMWPVFEDHFKASVFVGNAFFLQGRIGTFGSNSPLWSLANEFSYYCLYPLGWIASTANNWGFRIVAGALALLVAGVAGEQIILFASLWLLGAALYFIEPRKWASSRSAYWATLVGFLIILASVQEINSLALHAPGRLRSFVADIPIATTFTLWLYCVLNQPARAVNGRLKAFFTGFAGFSYSLYLVHLPVAILIHSAILKDHRLPLDAKGLAGMSGVVLTCVAVAYGMWFMFESRTSRVRDWAKARLGMAKLPRVDGSAAA